MPKKRRWLGCRWAFAANAASFAISGLLLNGLRTAEVPRPVTVVTIRFQVREALGLRCTGHGGVVGRGDERPGGCLAARRLHASGGGYRLLFGAIAAGAFAGPVQLTRIRLVGRGQPDACARQPARPGVQRI